LAVTCSSMTWKAMWTRCPRCARDRIIDSNWRTYRWWDMTNRIRLETGSGTGVRGWAGAVWVGGDGAAEAIVRAGSRTRGTVAKALTGLAPDPEQPRESARAVAARLRGFSRSHHLPGPRRKALNPNGRRPRSGQCLPVATDLVAGIARPVCQTGGG